MNKIIIQIPLTQNLGKWEGLCAIIEVKEDDLYGENKILDIDPKFYDQLDFKNFFGGSGMKVLKEIPPGWFPMTFNHISKLHISDKDIRIVGSTKSGEYFSNKIPKVGIKILSL